MRYVKAKVEEWDREKSYRLYVTRSLQLIPQNQYITTDFADVLSPKKIEKRSGEQIAIDIIKNAGLSFEG